MVEPRKPCQFKSLSFEDNSPGFSLREFEPSSCKDLAGFSLRCLDRPSSAQLIFFNEGKPSLDWVLRGIERLDRKIKRLEKILPRFSSLGECRAAIKGVIA